MRPLYGKQQLWVLFSLSKTDRVTLLLVKAHGSIQIMLQCTYFRGGKAKRCRSWCGGGDRATAAQWAVLRLRVVMMTCRRNRKLQHFFRRNLTFFGLLLKLDQSHHPRVVSVGRSFIVYTTEWEVYCLFISLSEVVQDFLLLFRRRRRCLQMDSNTLKRATLRTFDSVFIYNWSNQYTSSLLFVELLQAKEKLSPPVTTRPGH